MAKRKISPLVEECSSKLKCSEFLGRSNELLLERISKQNETLKLWLEIFPDAEPKYFYKKYNDIKNNSDQIEHFIAENLEKRNYPKLRDKRNEIDNAEKKFYTKEYSVEKFLKRFPDAVKYFLDEKRTSSVSREESIAYAINR